MEKYLTFYSNIWFLVLFNLIFFSPVKPLFVGYIYTFHAMHVRHTEPDRIGWREVRGVGIHIKSVRIFQCFAFCELLIWLYFGIETTISINTNRIAFDQFPLFSHSHYRCPCECAM